MRTFIAIKIFLNREVEEAIYHLRNEMKEEKIKWIDLNNLHLTLFFLGETPESQISQISSSLKRVVAENRCFHITLSGMGIFRSIRDPRVIWIGLEDNPDLQALHFTIRKLLAGFGYPDENRPFRPHLTIGRTKGITDKIKLMKEIEEHGTRCMQVSIIDEVVFYESILKERGPEYRIIEKCIMSEANEC